MSASTVELLTYQIGEASVLAVGYDLQYLVLELCVVVAQRFGKKAEHCFAPVAYLFVVALIKYFGSVVISDNMMS